MALWSPEACHSLILPSEPAVASDAPWGAKARARVALVAAGRTAFVRWLVVSQSRTGLSVEVAARVRPSGLKATVRTRPGTVNVAI